MYKQYTNTIIFYICNLSVLRLFMCRGSWNQSPCRLSKDNCILLDYFGGLIHNVNRCRRFSNHIKHVPSSRNLKIHEQKSNYILLRIMQINAIPQDLILIRDPVSLCLVLGSELSLESLSGYYPSACLFSALIILINFLVTSS